MIQRAGPWSATKSLPIVSCPEALNSHQPLMIVTSIHLLSMTSRPASTQTPSRSGQTSRPIRPSTIHDPFISPSSAAPSPKRLPLGDISVKSFQDRHRTEFAHLHRHSDEELKAKRLEGEKQVLEEARRLGREKRESIRSGVLSPPSAVPLQENVKANGRVDLGRAPKTWRPLSLVNKRAEPKVHGRSVSSGPVISARVQSSTRRHTGSHTRSHSDAENGPALRPGSNSLNVVVESHPSADDTPLSSNASMAQSSYSWASQFSGETSELRTAARYVSKTPDDELEELDSEHGGQEVLDSPTKTARRRKKIVALAHTVRQLEGIGSREEEDPAFYATLVKAWNERPGGELPGPQSAFDSSSSEARTSTAMMSSPHLPHTPNFPDGFGTEPDISDSTAPEGSETSPATGLRDKDAYQSTWDVARGTHPSVSTATRQSVRYSYASTLHDLAMDGGIQQANKLMSEKPWLKGSMRMSVISGSPYNDFNPRPLSVASYDPSLQDRPSLESTADIDTGHVLRKAKGTVVRPATSTSPLTAAPPPLMADSAQPAPKSSSSAWSLGLGNWWKGSKSEEGGSPSVGEHSDEDQFEDAQDGPDFHIGEDGTGQAKAVSVSSSSTSQEEASLEPQAQVQQVTLTPTRVLGLAPMLDSAVVTPTKTTSNLVQNDDQTAATASPSSSPCLPPTWPTHSITSFTPTVTTPTNHDRIREEQAVVEETQSGEGEVSSHSSENSSSPSKRTSTQRPKLNIDINIQRATLLLENVDLTQQSVIEDNSPLTPGSGQDEEQVNTNMSDPRFSAAYVLAQSLTLPSPTIRSPPPRASSTLFTQQSMQSLRSLSPTIPAVSGTGSRSVRSSSLACSESGADMEMMAEMTGTTSFSRPAIQTRVSMSSLPSATSRALSPSPSPILGQPRRMTASPSLLSPCLATPTDSVLLTEPRRGSVSAQSPTITPSIRFHNHDKDAHHSDTVQSSLAEFEFGPNANTSGTGQRLSVKPSLTIEIDPYAVGSVDELSSPSVSDLTPDMRSLRSSSFIYDPSAPRMSKYQQHQQATLERSRRANARVAARMSGLPKEKSRDRRASRLAPPVVEPPKSQVAVAFFILGFLGPWFWILGGWLPLHASSGSASTDPATAEEGEAGTTTREKGPETETATMLDFSPKAKLPNGLRWTYHPDPWMRRCRVATAVVAPVMLLGGIGAAVALGIVF